jgi:serine/threonine protein kinase
MKKLDHENMCIPYRFMKVEDEIWIAMELLEGGTLKKAAASEGVFQEKNIAYVARETLKVGGRALRGDKRLAGADPGALRG